MDLVCTSRSLAPFDVLTDNKGGDDLGAEGESRVDTENPGLQSLPFRNYSQELIK